MWPQAGWGARAAEGSIVIASDHRRRAHTMRMLSFLIMLGAIALFLGIAAFTPYTFTALPECRILVTNSAGKPVDNAEAYETGSYFEVGKHWAEKRVTDREG